MTHKEKKATLAVIGGSGFYKMPGANQVDSVAIDTPWGTTSAPITIGSINGVNIAFLPRHGTGHTISPTLIPARANIWALKSLGVEYIISVTAVGSLREEIDPLHLVIPD